MKTLPLELIEARNQVVKIVKQDNRFYWSKEWREFRKLYIEWHGNYCDNCHSDEKKLQLHHDYRHDGLLPGEPSPTGDWRLFCEFCHALLHGKGSIQILPGAGNEEQYEEAMRLIGPSHSFTQLGEG